MNDKFPRNPFGSGERTIIRPNPGGRRPEPAVPPGAATPFVPAPQNYAPPRPVAPQATHYAPPSAPGNPNPDEWIATPAPPPAPMVEARAPELRIDDLVAPNENPILRSAGPRRLAIRRSPFHS